MSEQIQTEHTEKLHDELKTAMHVAGKAEPMAQDRPPEGADKRKTHPLMTPEELQSAFASELRRNEAALTATEDRIGYLDETMKTLKAEAKRERARRTSLRRAAKMLTAAIEADGGESEAA